MNIGSSRSLPIARVCATAYLRAQEGKLYHMGIRGRRSPQYLGQCERGGATGASTLTWPGRSSLNPYLASRMSMLMRL